MMMKRCIPCSGSGRLMGGGMMIVDCDHCDGEGKVSECEDDIDYLSIKKTESYKNAKNKLKDKYPDLGDEEAESLLDEAFEKDNTVIKKTRKRRLLKNENNG